MKDKLNIILVIFGILSATQASQIYLESDEGETLQIKMINNNNQIVIQTQGQDSFTVLHNEKELLKYSEVENQDENDPNKSITTGKFESSFDLKVKGELKIDSFEDNIVYLGQKQWKLFEFNDFQSQKKGWSHQSIGSCGTSENIFLGGHCNFGGIIVSKEFANIPNHTKVMVSFNFHFFDDWNGEIAFAKINADIQWQESYSWCSKLLLQQCKDQGINTCGKDTPDRMSYPVNITFFSSDPSFTLSIGTNLAQNPCDASWGIDDVQIYIQ